MKRGLDLVLAIVLLGLLSPLFLFTATLIWLEDRQALFYLGERIGRGGKPFRMVKFRSMRVNPQAAAVMSTAADDPRITRIGRTVRTCKLDEIPQLFNVIRGDMSFVGPRPNVLSDVRLYSDEEMGLLAVRPGITDLASIVFSDEGEILRGSADPERDYNLLIRPWKSRLGLHYIQKSCLRTDLEIMLLTGLAVISRPMALKGVQSILLRTRAPGELTRVSNREEPLHPHPPPGVSESNWEGFLS